jgi:hypothetical protein
VRAAEVRGAKEAIASRFASLRVAAPAACGAEEEEVIIEIISETSALMSCDDGGGA